MQPQKSCEAPAGASKRRGGVIRSGGDLFADAVVMRAGARTERDLQLNDLSYPAYLEGETPKCCRKLVEKEERLEKPDA